jgi:hypothetical protein
VFFSPFLTHPHVGSGALKSDFTRSGSRTVYGVLQDGYKALQRYYVNNALDGFHQDAYDLFLGNYTLPHAAHTHMHTPLFPAKAPSYIRMVRHTCGGVWGEGVRACPHACVCVCVCVCLCLRACTCVSLTQLFTHIHTYTHAPLHTFSCLWRCCLP